MVKVWRATTGNEARATYDQGIIGGYLHFQIFQLKGKNQGNIGTYTPPLEGRRVSWERGVGKRRSFR